jgi:hypothetical protein
VTLLDQCGDAAAGCVLGVAGLDVPGLLGEVADVDPGEVHQLERAHRVAQGRAADRVDRLDRRDAVLEQEDRLVPDGVEDPVGHEARDLLVQDDG